VDVQAQVDVESIGPLPMSSRASLGRCRAEPMSGRPGPDQCRSSKPESSGPRLISRRSGLG